MTGQQLHRISSATMINMFNSNINWIINISTISSISDNNPHWHHLQYRQSTSLISSVYITVTIPNFITSIELGPPVMALLSHIWFDHFRLKQEARTSGFPMNFIDVKPRSVISNIPSQIRSSTSTILSHQTKLLHQLSREASQASDSLADRQISPLILSY